MQHSHHITLAVFPFENLSIKKNSSIFCRSFSEDLVTELSRFRQLRVIKYPGYTASSVSVQKDFYVQGTFRLEKGTVRINVQLFDRDNNHLIWANRLEDKLASMGEIHDNLLKSVVTALQKEIDLNLLSRIKQRPKVAFSAYEHWLYGMKELEKASVEADLAAREHFKKALQIQPDYALAYTGMSLSYFNEWTCQLWDRWEVNQSGAYEWAQKAIELDDQNHVIAMVLGRVFLYGLQHSGVLLPTIPDA